MKHLCQALFGIAVAMIGFGCNKSPTDPSARQYSVSGTVRDSEMGAPIQDAVVTMEYLHQVVITDGAGKYAIQCDSCLGLLTFDGSTAGFESRYAQARATSDTVDVTLQRIVRIEPGNTFVGTVFPDESSISVEDNCGPPCKLVRVSTTRDGVFDAYLANNDIGAGHLSWQIYKLNFPATGPVHVKAREDLLVTVYRLNGNVGSLTAPQMFVLATSFVPD